MMHSRFDYIQYDGVSQSLQMGIKAIMERIEHMLDHLPPSREKSLAITKLEEAYLWIGKAIRDDQLSRSPAVILQEERGKS